MSEIGPEELTKALFPNGAPNTKEELAALLELYTLMVGTSESLVVRRQNVNTFFLSVNSLIVAGVGVMIKDGLATNTLRTSAILAGVAGIILCYVWWRMIESYGTLNKGKFTVINKIEEFLSASPFSAEWKALEVLEYKSFTRTEGWVPGLFGSLYVAVCLLGLYKLLAPLLCR